MPANRSVASSRILQSRSSSLVPFPFSSSSSCACSSAILSPAAWNDTLVPNPVLPLPSPFALLGGDTGRGIKLPPSAPPASAARLLLDRRLSNRLVGDAAELNSASSIIDTGRSFGLPCCCCFVGVVVEVLETDIVRVCVCVVELDAGPPPPPPSDEEVMDPERVRWPFRAEYEAMRVGVACSIEEEEEEEVDATAVRASMY